MGALEILNVPRRSKVLVFAEINAAIETNPGRDDVHRALVIMGPDTVWMGRRETHALHVIADHDTPFVVVQMIARR